MADSFTQPSRPVTPTPPAPATSTTYSPSPMPDLVSAASGAILHHESGSTPGKLNNPTSPVGAKGPGQIMPATFKQYALPGENINNPADNIAVHNRIMADYARRWPNDPARWSVAYFSGPGNVAPPGSPTPWIRNTSDGHNTVSQYVANTAGKIGSVPSNNTAATPAPAAAAAPVPSTVGGMLGTLNDPGSPPSAARPDPGPSQAPQPPPFDTQRQMAAMYGNPRQQQIAQQAAAMNSALMQKAAQPLSWGPRTPGSTAGPQAAPQAQALWGGQQVAMPGTTLNSVGNYGG